MNDKNFGSSFDAFLQEGSTLEEATEVAIERIVDWLNAEALKDSESDRRSTGSNSSSVLRPILSNFSRSRFTPVSSSIAASTTLR